VKFVDLHGDSVNVAALMRYDNVMNTNNTQPLVNDLQSQTGLTISTSNSQMTYEKDANGNPKIATTTDANGNVVQVGSATARAQLMRLIDNQNTIEVSARPNKGSATSGSLNQIGLDPTQINSFITGSVNVDNRTLGWGMTFLHESYHTTIGGGLSDTPYNSGNPGPVETQLNIVRSELNAQGGNYGQRLNYEGLTLGVSNAYIPFNNSSQISINFGLIPGAMPNDKFIRFKP
jgi:hypothetical protein